MLSWITALLFAVTGAVIYETGPPSRTGFVWRHDNALSPRRYLPESIGPGVAFLDFDRDGWMDLYFVNSGPSDFYQPARPLRNALYRNRGNGTFEDVTEKAGVPGRDFGIGVTAADYDGDGWVDLFVTNYGTNILYRNRGNGTFEDVTAKAGLAVPGLWTAAVFFDIDGDGHLDLFTGHFVEYRKELELSCLYGDRYHYCHPLAYRPFPSRLFRNKGDGTFADVSQSSGVGALKGKVFGAVATDIDNDGRLDLFVANDSVANFLFHNLGGGRFEEIGLNAGVAYSADGNPRSGMGVDAADYDGDGLQDLFVANFNRERFSIYRNRGKLEFSDQAGQTGIGMATQMYSGWGVRFFDFDLDGDEDLIICNGHPDDRIEEISATLKYKEPLLLFENREGRFHLLASSVAGEAFQKDWPARGLAVGDLNNDGLPDVVVGISGGEPLVLQHTRGGAAGQWIGLDLQPRMPGTRVSWSAGGRVHRRQITAGGSFLSSDDPRVLLGLGDAAQADWIEVQWPGAAAPVRAEKVRANRYYRWRMQQGRPE